MPGCVPAKSITERRGKRMAKPTKDNRKSVVDFGVGWVVIIYCLLMFFLYVGMCNDGANITAPNVAYRLGLEQGDIMNMNLSLIHI